MPTATASRGCSTRGRPTRRARRWPASPDDVRVGGARLVRHHRGRQLRGPIDPEPAPRPRGAGPATGHRSRPTGAVRRSRTSPAARSRRQGAHRVERVVPVGAGRGGGRVRPAGLARRGGRQRRVPAARAAPAERALVAELAGRRRTAGAPRRARRRPRRARRCVHAARRGHRAGPLDRRGGGGGRHDARVVLGSGERRPLHDRRGRRGAHRPPEGPGRQRHAVGQLDGGDRALPPRRAHR